MMGTVAWLAIWLLIANDSPGWRQLLLPTAVVLLVTLFVVRHELVWKRPMRRICTLVDEINRNEAPIDELSSLGGGPTELIPLLQTILRENRRQRQQMSILQEEMRQRVASRTGALERKLGSLQEQASRDTLTGLRNRRAFERELVVQFEQSRLNGSELCLLMIDIDYFKQLNDTLGHSAGDELLRSIGQIIRSTIREEDAAYRYGGDELVVMMPSASLADATATAARLKSLVDALVRPLRLRLPPALSIGISTRLNSSATTATQLLEIADQQLYTIKQQRPIPSRSVA